MPGILVVAEHMDGALRDITGEMIGAATGIKDGLKDPLGGPLMVAVIGDADGALAEAANLEGVDEVVAIAAPHGHFDAALYEEAVCALAGERSPGVILVAHSAAGMAYGPAVAARLGSGFASDVFDIKCESSGIIATRGSYGGKVNMELGFAGKGCVTLMLRGATFTAPESAGDAGVTQMAPDFSALDGQSTHLEYQPEPPADVDIAKAEFILSVGRAVQDDKNVAQFAALAERLGATFGCSRPVADSGWLPKAHQVGQSGTIASNCKLYIALGISGAVQHLAGMKHVETIIAVNTDANAPMFNVAHYGATVDIFELAEALEKEFN